MTVSAAKASYRVRIAEAGASTMGTPALTLEVDADITDPPLMSGATVEPLKGSLVRQPFTIPCIVDDVLFTDSGRLTELGRLIDVQRSLDGGAHSTMGTGRISHVGERDERGRLDLEVSDQSWTGKRARLFKTTTSVQLHPPGLAAAFMNFPAAGSETYTVIEVSGNAVRIESNRAGAEANAIPRSMRDALRADLFDTQDLDTTNSNSDGNFTGLRFDLDSGGPSPGDRTVLSFANNLGGLTTPSVVLGNLRPAGDGTLRTAWVYMGSGHGLAEDDEVVGRFYFVSGIRTSENVPTHIGGVDGIHPMTLAKEITEGDHGGDAQSYDAAAMAVLEALPFQRVWLRTWGQDVERPDWLAKNIYQIYAVAPLIGTDLNLRPSSIALPQDVSLGSIATIGAGEADRLVWSHQSKDAVNVIEFSSRVIDELTITDDRGTDWPVDGLVGAKERLDDISHDTVSTLGEIPRKYETELTLSRGVGLGGGRDVATVLSQAIFNVFGDGPQEGAVQVAENAGHESGNLALLEHDTLKGFNAETGDRSGDRLVRLLAPRQINLGTLEFDYLDMGPGNVALSAPSVVITQDGTDPDLVNVAVSGLSAGETAIVQCTAGASTPSEYDYVRKAGNETIRFRLGAASGNGYARVKATAPGRMESAWATDSVALSARAKIDAADVVRLTLGDFEASWEVPSGTGGMKTDYSIHSRLEGPTFGSNEQDYDAADGGFTVEGEMRSTREMVTVRFTPYPGFSAGSVTGTPGAVMEVSAIFIRTRGGPVGERRPLVRHVSERMVTAGVVGSGQAWKRELTFTPLNAKSVEVAVGGYLQALGIDSGGYPSTTVSGYSYTVDVTSDQTETHTIKTSGGSVDATYGLTYDEHNLLPGAQGGYTLTLTPYSEVAGGGVAGTPVVITAKSIPDYEDLVRLVETVDRRIDNNDTPGLGGFDLDLDAGSNGFAFEWENTLGYDVDISVLRLYMKATGSPTSSAIARIRSDSSGLPGSILATSATEAASGIGASYEAVVFDFATPYTVPDGTTVHIGCEYSAGTGSDYLSIEAENAGSHSELNGSWAAGVANRSLLWRLYAEDQIERIGRRIVLAGALVGSLNADNELEIAG